MIATYILSFNKPEASAQVAGTTIKTVFTLHSPIGLTFKEDTHNFCPLVGIPGCVTTDGLPTSQVLTLSGVDGVIHTICMDVVSNNMSDPMQSAVGASIFVAPFTTGFEQVLVPAGQTGVFCKSDLSIPFTKTDLLAWGVNTGLSSKPGTQEVEIRTLTAIVE